MSQVEVAVLWPGNQTYGQTSQTYVQTISRQQNSTQTIYKVAIPLPP